MTKFFEIIYFKRYQVAIYGGLTMGHLGHGPQASRLDEASRFANHKKKRGGKEKKEKWLKSTNFIEKTDAIGIV